MQDAKEEIRARLPIEDVVSEYIELKRSGATLKGHSPWGVDKTPSFMVSPDKGIWHDFSANKGGDIFSFVMEVEGISFPEALEKLAAKAGVELKKYSSGDMQVSRTKMKMREILELATKFYQACLVKNEKIRDYVFYQRNLDRNSILNFRIGYAPSGKDFLVNFLKKRGYKEAEIKEAGLMNRFGGDFFRGRMMIPFIDASSDNVIGFTGRITEAGEPKYLNTSETLLFNKGRFIFGLNLAKKAIRENGFCVIVEGNMDVISSHQAGVQEAVATSGTAMTENHLKILARLTSDIRLAYDGDAAGVAATERAILMASKLGISLSVVSDYGKAKDPDELIRSAPEKWQECVMKPVPAIDWVLGKYEIRCNLRTGMGKKQYSDLAMKLIVEIQDPVERKHYEQMVARKLEVTVEDLKEKKVQVETVRLKPVKEVSETVVPSILKVLENDLLAILVYGGTAGAEIDLEIPTDEVKLEELSLIFEEKFAKKSEAELLKLSQELRQRYEVERNKEKKKQLILELESCEDEERMTEILKEIERLG